jgi:hypothetical protein
MSLPQSQPKDSSNSEEPLVILENRLEELLEALKKEEKSPLKDSTYLHQETITLFRDFTKELQELFFVTGLTDLNKLNIRKLDIYRISPVEEKTYLMTFHKALYYSVQSLELGKIGVLKLNTEVTQGPLCRMIQCLSQTIQVIADFFPTAGPTAGIIFKVSSYFMKRKSSKKLQALTEITTKMSLHHFDSLTSSEVENACLQTAISILDNENKRKEIHHPPILFAKNDSFFAALAYLYRGYVTKYKLNKLLNAQDSSLDDQEDLALADVYLLLVYLTLDPRALVSEDSIDKIFVNIVLNKRWNTFTYDQEAKEQYDQVMAKLKKKWKL